MTDETTNLVLEHLKRFQASLDRVERKQDEVILRLGRLETAVAVLQGDYAGLSVRLDRVGERIDRIERRLELV